MPTYPPKPLHPLPDDPDAWFDYGETIAEEDVVDGEHYARSREKLKAELIDIYDEAHTCYVKRRTAAVNAFLDGYYRRWLGLQEERQGTR